MNSMKSKLKVKIRTPKKSLESSRDKMQWGNDDVEIRRG